MEHFSAWFGIGIAILTVIILPLVNALITRKIDDLKAQVNDVEKARKDDRELFFKRVDDIKDTIANYYVRKDLYNQAMEFHQKETDSKFNNLIESMNKQFDNVEKNIEQVKDLINEKLNSKNKNGG